MAGWGNLTDIRQKQFLGRFHGENHELYLRNLKGKAKLREVFVDQCLFLKVSLRKDGRTTKKWLLHYSDGKGKQQRYTFGEYPEMGLTEARIRAAELLKQGRHDLSLAEQARQKNNGSTFGDIAEEWLEKKSMAGSPATLCARGNGQARSFVFSAKRI